MVKRHTTTKSLFSLVYNFVSVKRNLLSHVKNEFAKDFTYFSVKQTCFYNTRNSIFQISTNDLLYTFFVAYFNKTNIDFPQVLVR